MRFGLIRTSRNLKQFVNFNGESSNYLEYLYYVYRTDPHHLQKSWRNYFELLEQDKNYFIHSINRALLQKTITGHFATNITTSQSTELIKQLAQGVVGVEALKLNDLASAFRTYGHLTAQIDPLELPRRVPFFRNIENIEKKLDYKNYGITEEELKKKLPQLNLGGIFNAGGTVEEMIEKLNQRYCNKVSFEFGHMNSQEEVLFLIDKIENEDIYNLTKEDYIRHYTSICKAVKFENFCGKSFPTLKRFGMDGIESLLVLLESIEKNAKLQGVKSIAMTTSHRGRLNILANFFEKPLHQSFAEFRGVSWFIDNEFRKGDVKYHNGHLCVKDGLELQMFSNSSHLQFSHPVLTGYVKSKQIFENDLDMTKTLPIAIHGNSAISGQGMPYEVVQMGKIDGFSIGGTINIVVNNQIGFTANQLEASSSRYPTDVGKVIESPVIHVNAYDIESVIFAGKLALEYRQKFKNDVFVNLVGFRRFGHNELDMPKFTNAEMYSRVDKKPDLLVHFRNYLVSTGKVPQEEAGLLDEIEREIVANFQKELDKSKTINQIPMPIQNENWVEQNSLMMTDLRNNLLLNKLDSSNHQLLVTGLKREKLVEYGMNCSRLPDHLTVHNSIRKIFDLRTKAFETGANLDTSLAEVLAFASLSDEGFYVRVCGQESRRGTFSHRHSFVQDQATFEYHNTFAKYIRKLGGDNESITIYNSYLSELAAVGFEYGFSLYSPKILNVWEAQFGDFCNGAQVIIDSYLVSGEIKWNYYSGVVLFLPHGDDGQGPDHSSSRIERFLQMSSDEEDLLNNLKMGENYAKSVNISVVNCSSPSNLFHVLRRQLMRPFRKPLVCITGKKLLKLRESFSALSEFAEGTFFRRYVPDPLFAFDYAPYRSDYSSWLPGGDRGKFPGEKAAKSGDWDRLSRFFEKVTRVVVCSGQIYYDLLQERNSRLNLEFNDYLSLLNSSNSNGTVNYKVKDNKDYEDKLKKLVEQADEVVLLNRLEELTPFPAQWVLEDLRRFPRLKQVVWCQEEHMNGGPFQFVRPRFEELLKWLSGGCCPELEPKLHYCGRPVLAATAVGDPKIHERDSVFVKELFNGFAP